MKVVILDASDRDERSRCGQAYGIGECFESARIEFGFFGCCSKNGPEGDVVDRLLLCEFEFFQRMGRATDRESFSHIVGNGGGRYIGLSEVDSVGPCKQRDVEAIVQNEPCARLVC